MFGGGAWASGLKGTLFRPFSGALFCGGVLGGVGHFEAKASAKVSPFSALVGAYPRRAHCIEYSAGGLPRPIRYSGFESATGVIRRACGALEVWVRGRAYSCRAY